MPDCDPTGRAFTRQQKSELAEFCYNSGQSFFDECRSLAVENALTNVRIRDPGRKPRESDGPDLQHIVPALAYCDIFLTRDGYQAQCTEAVRTTLVGMNLALVCTDVEALEGV